MDTSEKYIKMCDKAPRMAKKFYDGDFYAYRIEGKGCPFRYTDVRMVYRHNILAPSEKAIPIYRQDQLQEMVYSEWEYEDILGFIGCLDAEVNPMTESGPCTSDYYFCESMEQLWLAFVMAKKYRRRWNSKKEEWVDEK